MKRIILIYILVAGAVLAGCKHEDYLYRDVSSRIWLGRRDTSGIVSYISDSSVSSFLLLPAAKLKDTLYVTANVTGETAPVDRPFKLEVVPGKTNVTSADYVIGQSVIPANSFTGRVPIIVNKTVPGLDLKKQRATLILHFMPNENFLNATPGIDTFRIIWYNFLARPSGWDAVQNQLGVFTQAKYKFILDFYGPINFERYRNNTSLLLGLQSAIRKVLRNYNADPANQGRPEGWPYLNDDGTPLTF